jgi:hypothetical protein
VSDPRTDLAAATRRFEQTNTDHEDARVAVTEAIVIALRAGVGPTEVAQLSPFTAAYVRKIARENEIPPAALGRKPHRRK